MICSALPSVRAFRAFAASSSSFLPARCDRRRGSKLDLKVITVSGQFSSAVRQLREPRRTDGFGHAAGFECAQVAIDGSGRLAQLRIVAPEFVFQSGRHIVKRRVDERLLDTNESVGYRVVDQYPRLVAGFDVEIRYRGSRRSR